MYMLKHCITWQENPKRAYLCVFPILDNVLKYCPIRFPFQPLPIYVYVYVYVVQVFKEDSFKYRRDRKMF